MDHLPHQLRDELNEKAGGFYKYVSVVESHYTWDTQFTKLSFIVEVSFEVLKRHYW